MCHVLTVATYNVNSIRVRLEQVLDWLARVQPDVLAVQETKCSDGDFPAEPIRAAGYHVAYRGQGGHGGVALITQKEPGEVAFGLDDGDAPDEHRLVRARVCGVAIVNTYVPQGRDVESDQFAYKLLWFRRLATAATEAWIDAEARLAARPSDHTFVSARFDLSRLAPPRGAWAV